MLISKKKGDSSLQVGLYFQVVLLPPQEEHWDESQLHIKDIEKLFV